MQQNPINHRAIDPFTFKHAAAGVLLGIVHVPLSTTAVLAIGWELIENPLKDRFPNWFPYPSHDSAANAVVDALAVVAGWAFARHLLMPLGSRALQQK